MWPPARSRIIPFVDGVSELNKHNVRLFVEAVLNKGRVELIDELIAADYAGHISNNRRPGVLGREGVRRLVSSRRGAYPDLYVKIEDQIAEDDRVVTRWQATATTLETLPTGDPARCTRWWRGISIIRLLAGKQVDSHTEYRAVAHDE